MGLNYYILPNLQDPRLSKIFSGLKPRILVQNEGRSLPHDLPKDPHKGKWVRLALPESDSFRDEEALLKNPRVRRCTPPTQPHLNLTIIDHGQIIFHFLFSVSFRKIIRRRIFSFMNYNVKFQELS